MPNPYKKPEDGGAAFPVLHSIDGNWAQEPKQELSGITKREYFAAQAIASGQLIDANNLERLLGKPLSQMTPKEAAEASARSAYNIADAMIKLADKPVLTAEKGKG